MLDIHSPNVPDSLAMPFALMENAFRRLTNLVKDMAPEALEHKGPDGGNSTATLLRHMAYTDLAYLHELKGQPIPAALDDAMGPYQTEQGALPEVTGLTVTQLLAEYQRVLEMTRAYLQTLSEEEATREVRVPWWGQPATVRYVLWHMASHSMLHQGQIARLKATYQQA